jgi:hypothetical protein
MERMKRNNDITRELGIGNLCLGHMPLAKEHLTEEDWAEVRRAYMAFQHHIKLIVLEARKRLERHGTG